MRSMRRDTEPNCGQALVPVPITVVAVLRLAFALLLAAASLMALCGSPALASTTLPSGSAVISEGTSESVPPSGTGNASVDWNAECPDPSNEKTHYWYVNSDAYHQDGSHANHQSTAETGVTSASGVHGLVLHIAPNLSSETFSVRVKLVCFPNPETIIANLSITLTRRTDNAASGGAGGGSGGGSGSGGSGTGGAGTGGGAGGSGGAVHCVVPKLAGRTLAKAKRLLEAAHCKLGKVTSPKHRKGAKLVVRSSAPKQGTRLPRDAKVKVRLRRA
jgi:hypothetical protein